MVLNNKIIPRHPVILFNYTIIMILNYLTLVRQLLIISYIKMYKFVKNKNNLLIHFKYYDFFYSGLFLHLLLKFGLYVCFNLQLYGEFNIILLLLSIYLCSIIDIHYYIYLILYKIIKYLLRYFHGIPAEYFYPYAPESEYMHLYLSYLHEYPEYNFSYNHNKERDRYLLIFRPIFLSITAIRYFIIREPLLFVVIHIFIIVNYLQDYNIILLYIYLLILHVSRFLFFMSEDHDRFKMSKWRASFYTVSVTAAELGFTHLNPYLSYNPKLIEKFTWNNMSLILYYSLREILRWDLILRRIKLKLSDMHLALPGYYFQRSWHFFHIQSGITTVLDNLGGYIPHIYQDCQKFVKRNQAFWLAFFILVIYFENLLITFLIALFTNEPTLIINNHVIDNNIFSIFSFELTEEPNVYKIIDKIKEIAFIKYSKIK